MAKIETELEETLTTDKAGKTVVGCVLTCGDCEHSVECAGRASDDIERKLLTKLKATCPHDATGKYVITSRV